MFEAVEKPPANFLLFRNCETIFYAKSTAYNDYPFSNMNSGQRQSNSGEALTAAVPREKKQLAG
ncbi:MAG: hypothetical protein RQ847_08220, partial [Wenzhouxiangellaceae bacterium]|nr:hypothetical protein [Wenzhouxiangellaceae bacterium]